mmetsp:Transcript_16758/g.42422  ORF Transcript_16758/g.42422 Transcript_16758/m.42422 type:complete len:265 (-) Transcript_16758:610-1404(-)
MLRATVGEAHEMVPFLWIKVHPRCGRNPCRLQHVFAELAGMICQVAHVCIDVKSPIRGRKLLESSFWELLQQDLPILGVSNEVLLQLFIAVKCRNGGNLRYGRRGDIHILRQLVHWPHEIGRQNHPSQSPACHAPVFAERVDNNSLAVDIVLQGRGILSTVGDVVVDFVRYESYAILIAVRDDILQLARTQHGACGIGWRCNQQPRELRPPRLLEKLPSWLEPGLWPHRDLHGLDAHHAEDIAVAGVAWPQNRHLIPSVEGGHE